jgi:hypothetical protein
MQEGAHGPWLRLLCNENLHDEKQALSKGYYAVKNPGQKQLNDGITFKEARESEDIFFRTDANWSQVESFASPLARLLARSPPSNQYPAPCPCPLSCSDLV